MLAENIIYIMQLYYCINTVLTSTASNDENSDKMIDTNPRHFVD